MPNIFVTQLFDDKDCQAFTYNLVKIKHKQAKYIRGFDDGGIAKLIGDDRIGHWRDVRSGDKIIMVGHGTDHSGKEHTISWKRPGNPRMFFDYQTVAKFLTTNITGSFMKSSRPLELDIVAFCCLGADGVKVGNIKNFSFCDGLATELGTANPQMIKGTVYGFKGLMEWVSHTMKIVGESRDHSLKLYDNPDYKKLKSKYANSPDGAIETFPIPSGLQTRRKAIYGVQGNQSIVSRPPVISSV